jgi:hypothetical protein
MRFLVILSLFLSPVFVGAQEARIINCRFLCFGDSSKLQSVIALSTKGEETLCPVSRSSISEVIPCAAPNNSISFVSSADKKPLATASIPASVNSALLVFIQLPAKPIAANNSEVIKPVVDNPWRVLVVDDSSKSFPHGGAFVANFYSQDIRFIIGEHKGLLHAAGMHGYEMPTDKDTFNMASVVFEFKDGEKWINASETALKFVSGIRYLIFAFADPISGRPRVESYQDIPTPKAPTPTP